ncbi:MAG: PAS domain S-box protein [Chitinivibrionales bacterium]|nr:PAS domain S-box protein [Chitinivibrionales bacterium]
MTIILNLHIYAKRDFLQEVVMNPELEEVKKALKQLQSRHKLVEEQLRQSERLYKTLANTIPDIIYLIDDEGYFLYLNDAVEDLGYKKEELLGNHFSTIIFPSDYRDVSRSEVLPKYAGQTTGDEKAPKLFDERRSGGRRTRELEVRVMRNVTHYTSTDELVVYSLVSSSGYYSSQEMKDGAVFLGTLGVMRDISHRKQTENALRESEERFREMAELLPTIICEIDLHERFTYVNRAAFSALEYTDDDLETGIYLEDIIHPRSQDRVRERIEQMTADTRLEPAEVYVISKRGEERILLVNSTPIHRKNKVVGIRTSAADITDRKVMEKELQKTEILESLGVLAGGIGHDFNNILAGIYGNVQLAKKKINKGEIVVSYLDGIEKATERAVSLAKQLLTFSKGGAPIRKLASITELLKESSEFALRGSNVNCTYEIEDDLWPSNVDEGQIAQVMNNLVLNASHAMPTGGTITIRAQNLMLTPESGVPLKQGRYIKVSVIDNGIGIPGDYLSKIFDPYFSTKQKGSGLGLAVTYSVVSRHDGYISAHSKVGEGTVFYFYLPASKEKAEDYLQEAPAPIAGEGKILLMDDDDIVRTVGSEILKDFGYEVVTTQHGAEAIDEYKQAMAAGEPYDVVILDLTIPGAIGGKEACTKLREIDPEVLAVVSSGYSDDPVMSHPEQFGFNGVATKPYQIDDLGLLVQRLIARKRSG